MNIENTSPLPVQYEGLLTVAKLPKGNPRSLDFAHYDITPVDHDYAGQFQLKANHVFEQLGLSVGFVMMVGDPARAAQIYGAFRDDPKYLGGGTGSGFKNKAPAVLDELEPLAKHIGAINVVAKVGSRLCGYNTDGTGFVRGLEELLIEERDLHSLKGRKVLILGAGGTADAIAFTLASKGAILSILNRTAETAITLAAHIREAYGDVAVGGGEELIERELPTADIIVNASKKGAEGPFEDFMAFAPAKSEDLEENLRQSAEAIKLLRPEAIVCDINLRADESPTLRLAREAGHLVQDGAPMNFHQAVEALWIIHEKAFIEKGATKEDIARLVKEVS